MSAHELPAAAQRFIGATNAEDCVGLLAAFADHGVVDDFGRLFTGHEQIGEWSDRENIGTHNRITVQRVTRTPGGTLANITVTGDGYNGGGTFAFGLDTDGLINILTIRG
ncbi:nuclear transport factor 2 family protein [Microbacterium betulae]|uniref:Nuclear transport factor 2 family protein n=1 Tax=Microbacterium betulae TaxID=2981139 RepID=A0AA97FIZ2_9MICO|nr:nuclear transport factor 2 family protein [Microbacterium sp. AB]WOF23920.1 nuclear transport factor 2 family protein [Microbacterium sp. AB]